MNYLTEREITQALKTRHDRRGDYFASQVKMGPSGSKILDAVAIPVTWSPRTIIGYEIKVSKMDFMNDQKYPHYMSTCHLFYFVVPKGLIKAADVPYEVGILEFSNGNLRQVKKPIYRKVEINTDMLLHCIFFKVGDYKRPKTRQEHLDDIKARVESKAFGSIISEKIRELERKNTSLKTKNDWDWFSEEFEKRFGFTPTKWTVFNYISVDNRKYNAAVELLKQAARLLEVK